MTLSVFKSRSHSERENWRYTDLDKLLQVLPPQKSNANLPPPDVEDYIRLIFINGIWQPKLSRFGSVPSCILMGDLESGYNLTLGEHTCLVSQPIKMIFVSDDNAPQEIALKLSITVGDNGRLTLLEKHLASTTITTVETTISLHKRAKLMHAKLVQGGTHLAFTQANVAEGGFYDNFSLLRGGVPVRNEIEVFLNGEHAQAALNGAMLLRGAEHADTTTRITHAAPNCASRQIYKTVLDEKSRGVFQGKIIVAEGAQKTDGYQLSRALLLSDQAEMDAKPELEIYADDVKCSHGSTVGDLDENAMFYLRARGLNEAEARALLIEAFIAEMLGEIKTDEWRVIFQREIDGWLR
jgi:Fe-S cluster assembly protein SufD